MLSTCVSRTIDIYWSLSDYYYIEKTVYPPSGEPRCAMVLGDVVSTCRDSLGLGRIGAPGYRAHRSVAMAPMFKGIRFGRHHFCSEVWEVVS